LFFKIWWYSMELCFSQFCCFSMFVNNRLVFCVIGNWILSSFIIINTVIAMLFCRSIETIWEVESESQRSWVDLILKVTTKFVHNNIALKSSNPTFFLIYLTCSQILLMSFKQCYVVTNSWVDYFCLKKWWKQTSQH
jgi:hypothetical protein